MFFRFTVNASARDIQRSWRGYACKRGFAQKVAAITVIQASVRSMIALNEFRKIRFSAVTVQASWRRYSAVLNFDLDMLEIVITQSVVRRVLGQREAHKRRHSIQLLQNCARRWQAVKTIEHLRCQHHDYLVRKESSICLQVSTASV